MGDRAAQRPMPEVGSADDLILWAWVKSRRGARRCMLRWGCRPAEGVRRGARADLARLCWMPRCRNRTRRETRWAVNQAGWHRTTRYHSVRRNRRNRPPGRVDPPASFREPVPAQPGPGCAASQLALAALTMAKVCAPDGCTRNGFPFRTTGSHSISPLRAVTFCGGDHCRRCCRRFDSPAGMQMSIPCVQSNTFRALVLTHATCHNALLFRL
jgi:hypothetical protein